MMKNKWLILGLFLSMGAFAKGGAEFVIAQQESVVRQGPSFLASSMGTLKYGTQVSFHEKKGSWYKVKHKKTTGWVHVSAFMEKNAVMRDLNTNKSDKHTYQDEVAAAGKGFNPDYEKAYKNENPELSYEEVDLIDKAKVSESDIEAFMNEGGLSTSLKGTN